MELRLRTDRNCGACLVCCRNLPIDDPALTKLPQVLCPHHNGQANGCAIYADRPATCQSFYCGWWYLPLGEEWRPDRCGIVIQWHHDAKAGISNAFNFLIFGGLDQVYWRPFITCLWDLAQKQVPLYISVPGPAGYWGRIGSLSALPQFQQAAARRDFSATAAAVSTLVQSCIDGPKQPISFVNPPTDHIPLVKK